MSLAVAFLLPLALMGVFFFIKVSYPALTMYALSTDGKLLATPASPVYTKTALSQVPVAMLISDFTDFITATGVFIIREASVKNCSVLPLSSLSQYRSLLVYLFLLI
jgi:hypothetical protein